MKKMCYHIQGPLNYNKNALIKPISHTRGWKRKGATNLGYCVKDDLPWFDKEVPIASESKDDIFLTHEDDFTPSTSLLLGEVILFHDNTFEVSTSRNPGFDESDVENLNAEIIRRNIAQLVA